MPRAPPAAHEEDGVTAYDDDRGGAPADQRSAHPLAPTVPPRDGRCQTSVRA